MERPEEWVRRLARCFSTLAQFEPLATWYELKRTRSAIPPIEISNDYVGFGRIVERKVRVEQRRVVRTGWQPFPTLSILFFLHNAPRNATASVTASLGDSSGLLNNRVSVDWEDSVDAARWVSTPEAAWTILETLVRSFEPDRGVLYSPSVWRLQYERLPDDKSLDIGDLTYFSRARGPLPSLPGCAIREIPGHGSVVVLPGALGAVPEDELFAARWALKEAGLLGNVRPRGRTSGVQEGDAA